MPFRWRLALYGSGVAAAAMLLFGGLLAGIATNAAPADQARALQTVADSLAADLERAGVANVRVFPTIGTVEVTDSLEAAVVLLDRSNETIGGTALENGRPLAVPPAAAAQIRAGRDVTFHASGAELRAAGTRFTAADGTAATAVAVQQTAATTEQLQGLRAVVWIAALIGFVVALGASWLVSGRALRPLRKLAALADEIRETGDLSRRLPPGGSNRDELGRITSSFNEMVSDLETSQQELGSALAAQRQFVADASHELRSPLTTIRNNAEFLMERDDISTDDRAEAIADIGAEAGRMSALVDDLLALARGESLDHREPVDVHTLVEDEAERLRRAGHPVDVHIERGSILGDPTALERLLRILTDNALRHGAPPLTLRCGQRRGHIYFGVADRGEGFVPGDLVRVFDRFYRADPVRRRHGSGLGLAIAAKIAEVHGGTMVAANRPGGGAVVEAELPPAPGD